MISWDHELVIEPLQTRFGEEYLDLHCRNCPLNGWKYVVHLDRPIEAWEALLSWRLHQHGG